MQRQTKLQSRLSQIIKSQRKPKSFNATFLPAFPPRHSLVPSSGFPEYFLNVSQLWNPQTTIKMKQRMMKITFGTKLIQPKNKPAVSSSKQPRKLFTLIMLDDFFALLLAYLKVLEKWFLNQNLLIVRPSVRLLGRNWGIFNELFYFFSVLESHEKTNWR